MERKEQLSTSFYTIKELVEELSGRYGVETSTAAENAQITVRADGPVTVLVVKCKEAQ